MHYFANDFAKYFNILKLHIKFVNSFWSITAGGELNTNTTGKARLKCK
jgi:hypothetical protein